VPGECRLQTTRIVGSVQVKNEDVYIEQVVLNILDFCDEVIITDNLSTDHTYEICKKLARQHSKIKLKSIQHPREAAFLLEPYFGTDTWILGVDGDEIYDPNGLRMMRERLLRGEFSGDWCVFGNVLNVISLRIKEKKASGYLAPPSRSMTKLYNFYLIENWVNCPERLLGDELTFKSGFHAKLRKYLHIDTSWEQADFRCLHMPFMKRSSRQRLRLIRTRLNPDELDYINRQPTRLLKAIRKIWFLMNQLLGKDWKSQKYRRGPIVEKDVSAFFS
jgi:glycosyltransferase involved in cell wall biosynthesis